MEALVTLNRILSGSKMSKEPRDLRVMADMLRQGATLTELPCPACSSPLFKLRSGDLWCAQCQKPVIVVKEGVQPAEATGPLLLSTLEATILTKIQEMDMKIREEKDPESLQRLSAILSTLLESLERIRRMRGT